MLNKFKDKRWYRILTFILYGNTASRIISGIIGFFIVGNLFFRYVLDDRRAGWFGAGIVGGVVVSVLLIAVYALWEQVIKKDMIPAIKKEWRKWMA